MLCTRSGGVQAIELPVASGETNLAEMGQVIADARAEIDRLIQLGELQNDPIRHPIQALSVHLDALYQVTLAGSQTLAKQIQTSDASRMPVRDDDLRRAVAQGISGHAGALAKALNVKNTLIISGLLVAAVLVGAGGGYWFRGEAPILAGVHAGAERCEDRADGSRLCWLPIWEKLPPAH